MPNRLPDGTQVDTISRFAPEVQESFDLDRLDAFVVSLGVQYTHYRAMPSPIGKNDRGDLRRNDGVDTITSNGMIYRLGGKFTATLTNNERDGKRNAAGTTMPSQGHLVMPRFYDTPTGAADGERIYMMPGDRLYISDAAADVKVPNSEEMAYQDNVDNIPMFPIVALQDKIIDSRGIEYAPNIDFVITNEGNIRWIGNNPGIDVNTGKGRNYSIRYLYNAYYYVIALPHEIRITNVTTNGIRSPQRMAYEAMVVREYLFHNQNRGGVTNQNVTKTPERTEVAPIEPINPNKFVIPVDMSTIENVEKRERDQS